MLLVLVVTSTTAGSTAANNVSPTRAEDDQRPATAEDLKPDECAGIVLTAKVSGQGQINGGNAAELITGSSVADNIDGGRADDCIVGGAGDDNLRGGGGTDVCLGGGGNDTFHPSCETSIQ